MAGELVLVNQYLYPFECSSNSPQLTGATGMIGFKTLLILLKSGYKVRAAVRNKAGFDRIAALKPIAPYVLGVESFIVPDITIAGAYNEAVKGVKYIIHMASPLATNIPEGVDYDSYMIQPAIRGTVGILESASKVTGIQRVVITASILSITSLKVLAEGSPINGTSI